MKYLCLVYFNEQEFKDNPDSPKDIECFEHARKLESNGKLISGHPLEPVETATTVRVRDGKVSITDLHDRGKGPGRGTRHCIAHSARTHW